ncbi:hypothetical protein CNR22_05120 [Sphingobacteriaceae bacterium]|nr:hypothetical protein CNR22_05120 [Sphingobacteriaceae bacterium]
MHFVGLFGDALLNYLKHETIFIFTGNSNTHAKLKTRALILLITFLVCHKFGSAQERLSFCTYKDALIEVNECVILLKDTYTRKNLFTRTTVYFTNPTDNFVILDTKNIFLSSDKKSKLSGKYDRLIIIAPHYTRKFYLKFPAKTFMNDSICFDFSRMDISNGPGKGYEAQEIPAKTDNTMTWDNLTLHILEKKRADENYILKLQINYKGSGFLAVDEKKVSMKFSHREQLCINSSIYPAHFYFSAGPTNEILTVAFPINCYVAEDRDKVLFLKDVFTEYPVALKPGGRIILKISEDSALHLDDKEEEKGEKN